MNTSDLGGANSKVVDTRLLAKLLPSRQKKASTVSRRGLKIWDQFEVLVGLIATSTAVASVTAAVSTAAVASTATAVVASLWHVSVRVEVVVTSVATIESTVVDTAVTTVESAVIKAAEVIEPAIADGEAKSAATPKGAGREPASSVVLSLGLLGGEH